MRLSGENARVRAALFTALLLVSCSKESAPGKPAHAQELPTHSAVAAASSPPPPASASVAPPTAHPKHTGPMTITTDAGVVPAAKAERILHVGDSMVPLVGNYLRPILQADGRKYYIDSVVSSSTLTWGGERLLQDAMYKYDPDLIIISLGSNELFDPTPERRVPAIKQIVEDTRGRPCLWIGPPAWKKDTGFLDLLKKNLGHCRYFDSTRLNLPRMADGRHPDWTGGYRWASAVWKVLGGTQPVPTGNPRPEP